MSQPEDTELRDLVIQALEKNGTLPTIRAQLRANIFNVFEIDQQIKNENSNVINRVLLDKQSSLSFSIIYEFLEYCGLKNTLFVYKSESRHGKGYVYEGKRKLINKFNSELKLNESNEPILVQLIKTLLGNSSDSNNKTNTYMRYTSDCGDVGNEEQILYANEDVPPLITFDTPEKNSDSNNKKDEENCTYIVHDDTASFGSCTYSQSDNSPDRYKLQLKLHLEQSETDTSTTDSNRDKSSSDEYIPSDNIPLGLVLNESHTRGFCLQSFPSEILMQSPLTVSPANESFINSDNRHPARDSFKDKYKLKTNNITSYMHNNIEPKEQEESETKKVSFVESSSNTSTALKEMKTTETKHTKSYSPKNSATTDNITPLLDFSNLTLDENVLKSNNDKSHSNIIHLLKSQKKNVESNDSEKKILINISPTTKKSKQKQDEDSFLLTNIKSKNVSAKQNSERSLIISKIAKQVPKTDFYIESTRSEGNSIESLTHTSNSKSDSDSIQEEINITNNNSEFEESPRDINSRSSISISDIAELIESSQVDSPVKERTSSQKKTNSYHSPEHCVPKLTNPFNRKNLVIVDSPFKDLPSNKNITLRSCSNLNEDEKAKFLRVTDDVDTYSDSFSQKMSDIPTENMEWKSESI